jgi:hypothetical protein
VGWWVLLYGSGLWAWVMCLGHLWTLNYVQVCYCFLAVCRVLFLISLHQCLIGLGGHCPSLHTQRVLSNLRRRRAVGKWMLPPSGRMKRRATEIFGRLHSEKASLISDLCLCFGLIFPICHRYCKADGVSSCVIPTN